MPPSAISLAASWARRRRRSRVRVSACWRARCMLPPGRRSATTVQHAPWKSMAACAPCRVLPAARGRAGRARRGRKISEDVERFLVQRVLVAVVGVVLHALEVLALDVFGDPAAAVGDQRAVVGHRNLDHTAGRLDRTGLLAGERVSARYSTEGRPTSKKN